jgi:hypothetical protein
MQSDQAVIQWSCCRGKRQVLRPFTHALAQFWVSTESSSKRLFCFHGSPQSGLANGPMSGPHSCTDGIAVTTPMPVAFRSDHVNEQHKPTSAFSPRDGRSINRIRRSACSSPLGWLKTPKPHRSGVLGSCYGQTVDAQAPSVYDACIPLRGVEHGQT